MWHRGADLNILSREVQEGREKAEGNEPEPDNPSQCHPGAPTGVPPPLCPHPLPATGAAGVHRCRGKFT